MSERPFIIVGIGASAGGLEALETFLAHLPAESGMAFVLVQHLDPAQPSLMPELLARHTKMSVQTAEDGMRVEPNRFYVMPPNVRLTIQGGVLHTSTPIEHVTVRTHIDTFLRSLADDRGEHAIGVILSGAGSDGTSGLKAIKEHGGVTVAQSPASARYDSMPLSAIATGLVDFTLPVEEIPAKLVEHAGYLESLNRRKPMDALHSEAAGQLPRICQILHHVTGHDFSGYKPSTMVRRIERRMQVHRLDSVASYVSKLEQDPKEPEQLFKDLLIGVTQFFRDPDAFEALANQAIPKLLENKGSDARIRIWVPGCASGEEAYSIAILLCEHMAKLNISPQAQIFATDIDDEAIELARLGRYPASLVEHVSPQRLERFFVRHGETYQVSKQIRDLCVFSIHNLVRDPPFSSLDLIACRNLLIYLDGELQKKLIPLFHYALSPGGYLFLGSAEGLAGAAELFREVEKKHRLFQRTEAAVRSPVDFPLGAPSHPVGRRAELVKRSGRGQAADLDGIMERMVLNYAPPCVVINERAEIVRFSGDTSPYLQQPAGAPTLSIIDQARKGLRLSLRTAIRQAIKTRQMVVQDDVVVQTPGGVQGINVVVQPVPQLGENAGLWAVIFHVRARSPKPAQDLASGSEESAVQQLETELKTTRGELQTAVEELEGANEDLKSSNEELLSMNEEMQSANEELQTSKEEMQSVNEELGTINAELNRKVEQLDRANADLQNLIRSTEIATLFLDRDLRIRRFTPSATKIFRLIDSDVGRPIGDFAPRLADGDLIAAMKEVLQTLATQERQAYLPETRSWFMVRLLPSRTVNGAIDGVVVTFVDITALKGAEDALRQSEERSRQLADTIPHIAWTARPDGMVDYCNDRVRQYKGYQQRPDGTWDWIASVHPDDAPPTRQAWAHAVKTGQGYQVEHRLCLADGQWHWHLSRAVPIRDQHGRVAKWSGTATDIHDLRMAQEELAATKVSHQRAREVAERASRAKDEFLAVLSHELRTPLAPVIATLSMLQADPRVDADLRQDLEMIHRNVELEARLIDDLLDVTRIESGKVELDRRPTDLASVIRQAAEVCTADIETKKLEFGIDAPDGPYFVDADAARLEQVFWNLVKNAVKFTQPGGCVGIRCRRIDDHVIAEVNDSGQGIDPEVLPRLFRAFEQGGKRTTRQFGGAGLGAGDQQDPRGHARRHAHSPQRGQRQGGNLRCAPAHAAGRCRDSFSYGRSYGILAGC